MCRANSLSVFPARLFLTPRPAKRVPSSHFKVNYVDIVSFRNFFLCNPFIKMRGGCSMSSPVFFCISATATPPGAPGGQRPSPAVIKNSCHTQSSTKTPTGGWKMDWEGWNGGFQIGRLPSYSN